MTDKLVAPSRVGPYLDSVHLQRTRMCTRYVHAVRAARPQIRLFADSGVQPTVLCMILSSYRKIIWSLSSSLNFKQN